MLKLCFFVLLKESVTYHVSFILVRICIKIHLCDLEPDILYHIHIQYHIVSNAVGGQGGYLRGGEATPREEDPRPAAKLSSW